MLTSVTRSVALLNLIADTRGKYFDFAKKDDLLPLDIHCRRADGECS